MAPLDRKKGLQQALQERLIEAILAGAVPIHEPLPATRVLAKGIGISRNTVALVYERLAEDGYLRSINRRGYFVEERYVRTQLHIRMTNGAAAIYTHPPEPLDIRSRLARNYLEAANPVKPSNWRDYPYPFIFGQLLADRISIAHWRDCMRIAGTTQQIGQWIDDQFEADDPMLVEQVIRRMLPRRGFRAAPDEILITVGAQNALYMIATLFCRPGIVVGIEDPGYVDARNIFRAQGAALKGLALDAYGVRVGAPLADCNLVYVTPGHQAPTSVTMSLERRISLLKQAEEDDFLIVEDDYEHELNFVGPQRPAIRSYDRSGRVMHVGSLSKPFLPGIRLGFIAAARPVIAQMRALRRLMYRHPSSLDQRAMALFLAHGHYDGHIRRQREWLAENWKTMMRALDAHLPQCQVTMTTGGSSLWVRLPPGIDTIDFGKRCAEAGVLIEAGDIHFLDRDRPHSHIRLGFAAIENRKIEPGIAKLAEVLRTYERTQHKGASPS